MRNFVRTIVLTICILMLSVPVFASSDIRVQLNGEIIDFTDANGNKVESQIINSRTKVPMRKIFEVMGAEVEWINDTRSIIATTDELEIGLQIDNEIATVKNNSGEEKEIKLDSVPVIVNGRTLVPVRFIAESLDKKVGWDAQNRAVIIIDPNSVENIIKENASNLYEILSTETKSISTYDMNMELDGNIEMMYDNEMTNLDVTGDIDLKFSGNMLAMNVDLKATGSESVIESIGTDKIKLEMIVDGEKEEVYIKSDLIENSNGKWVKYVINEEKKGELRELLKSAALPSNGGIKEFVSSLIPEENLTLNYYNELEATLEIISQIMGNDNLKVTGTKDKTFKYEVELKDVLKYLRQDLTAEEEKELLNTIEFEFGFESKFEDGISKESKIDFVMGQKDEMRLELNLDGEFESYNENINIQVPNEKDVVDSETLRKLSPETQRMNFMIFQMSLSTVEMSIETETFNIQGKEVMKGKTRSLAQIYNFLARGGYNVIGENGWLTQDEASNIGATLIKAEYAEQSFGYALPENEVETKNGKEKVLYYVTPKGTVFAWPPHEYNGKCYVTDEIYVLNEKGEALTFEEATNTKRGIMYFREDDEVIIIKNGSVVSFEKGNKSDYVYNAKNYVNDNELVKTFYSFESEMEDLERNLSKEVRNLERKFYEKNEVQIYDYIARGKDLVIKTEDDWVAEEESENIICIKFDEAYAEYVFGVDLPNIKVDTYQKDDVQVSFYITSKGEVFCWPPYENAGKSYVNGKITAKDANGNELSNLEATKEDKVILYFKDTKEVVIVKNGRITNFEKGTINDVVFPKIVDFNAFRIEIYDLEDDIMDAYFNISKEETRIGNTRRAEQLYNVIARGGYNVIPQNKEGNSKWLRDADARNIVCTKIDEEYAIEVLGRPLPNVTVETAKGKEEKVSFFITNKGDVFCWPPFEYNGKAYVDSYHTVKDASGKDLTVKEATKLDKVEIKLGYSNTIIVSNKNGVKPIEYTISSDNAENVSVWYYKSGMVEGIDFSKYNNTAQTY